MPSGTPNQDVNIFQSIKEYKLYIAIVGPGSVTGYLIILFALQQTNASYIVAMREISVVIGSILGFIFLKERITVLKVVGMLFIVTGLVLVKIA